MRIDSAAHPIPRGRALVLSSMLLSPLLLAVLAPPASLHDAVALRPRWESRTRNLIRRLGRARAGANAGADAVVRGFALGTRFSFTGCYHTDPTRAALVEAWHADLVTAQRCQSLMAAASATWFAMQVGRPVRWGRQRQPRPRHQPATARAPHARKRM